MENKVLHYFYNMLYYSHKQWGVHYTIVNS